MSIQTQPSLTRIIKNNKHKALSMKNFLKNNWTLIFVILYIISPDLIPGPIDDTALLIAEITRRSILSLIKNRNKKQNS